MKKLIPIFLVSLLITSAQTLFSQSNDRITLTPYIDSSIAEITTGAGSILTNKLNQIVNQNGVDGNGEARFIITANVVVLSKDVVASAPPSIVYTLDVNLYIGDGIDGNKFSSYTTTVKGVGQNENKAMMDALKSIRPNNVDIQNFVSLGKKKVIAYYNERCDLILRQAKSLEAQNKFEEAIYKLSAIPEASSTCYDKALDAIVPIYRKFVDRDCKIKLQNAMAIWNAKQDLDAANEVGMIISEIDPQSACFSEVKTFSDKVAKRVLELDNREWKYKVDSEIGLKRDLIKAYRDVGVSYGNGQPKSIVYNVRGWW